MPLFAVEDWIVGVGASVAAVLGPLGVGVGWWLKRLDGKSKTTLGEWQDIVTRQDGHMAVQQQSLDEARRREARCREEVAELRQWVRFLHADRRAMEPALEKAGVTLPPIPDLPEWTHEDAHAGDFRANTEKQNTLLLHSEARRVLPGDGQ